MHLFLIHINFRKIKELNELTNAPWLQSAVDEMRWPSPTPLFMYPASQTLPPAEGDPNADELVPNGPCDSQGGV